MTHDGFAMRSDPGNDPGEFRQTLIPGLIGLSVFTDAVYLRAMHDRIAQMSPGAGGVSRLKYLLRTIDFYELVQHSRTGDWDLGEKQIAEAAASLQAGGAQFITICANTGYALTKLARERVSIPFLDIAQPVCRAIRAAGLKSPGLLSTTKTEAAGVYQLEAERNNLKLVSPSPDVARAVHALIIDELVGGHITARGVRVLKEAAQWFEQHGADSLILGCTDLTHLVPQLQEAGGTRLPLFDSTRLHAAATAEVAISGHEAAAGLS